MTPETRNTTADGKQRCLSVPTPHELTTICVGKYTVRRKHLNGTPHTVYEVMAGADVAGKQISYPSTQDCAAHISTHQALNRKKTAPRTRKKPSTVLRGGSVAARTLAMLEQQPRITADQLAVFMSMAIGDINHVLRALVARDRVTRHGKPPRYTYSISAGGKTW